MTTIMDQSVGTYVEGKPLLVLESAHSLRHALEMMKRMGVAAVGVQRNGVFSGILTRKEATRFLEQPDTGCAILESIMTVHPVCIGPDCEMDDVFALMSGNNLSHLPVVDGKELVGIVNGEELGREMAQAFFDLKRENRMMSYFWSEPYGAGALY